MNAARARRSAWLRLATWRRVRRKLGPPPMFVRFFAALIVLTVVASGLFGMVVGQYEDRVTAATLAPLWAVTIEAELRAQPSEPHATRTVPARVRVHSGQPPPAAYSVTDEPRVEALMQALAGEGVAITDVQLDDATDPPVTWLQVQRAAGLAPVWIGFDGGVQPALFRARTARALLALTILMAAAAWLASRWLAQPLTRLSRQVEAIGRGQVPTEPVRGPREIQSLGMALMSMAQQRAAFDAQRQAMLLGVSHDLRSPLTRIRVAADLLRNAELRALIVRNVEHADTLIDSFLTYVRTDSDPVDQAVDLGLISADAARLFELPPAQVQLEDGLVVRGNATALRRLVVNLLDNALRHGAPPIGLRVARDGAQALLTVSDHGTGIADPARMLQPFERGDSSRAQGGAGLGLAIVARIAARHGGSIEVGRVANAGAQVSIRLPLAPPD